MTTKKVMFDCFSIELPTTVTDIQNILDTVLPTKIGTLIRYKGFYLRLESYRMEGNIRIGSATKINTLTLPSKANIRVPGVQSLGLADDEGVANLTAFVIDPVNLAVVMQRNSQGVRAGSFVHLLENLLGISDIGLNIMLETDVVNKLNRMQFFSKFTVRIANPTAPQNYEDVAVRESAQIAQYYNARDIKLELGIGSGQNRGPLAIQRIKATINKLLNAREETKLQSLVVRGKENDDDRIEPLDLIQQRLSCEIDVPITSRSLQQDMLERAVWQAYEINQQEIVNYRPL